eukprot:scaffold366_cov153-Skeletonema_menzelii.AAC.32
MTNEAGSEVMEKIRAYLPVHMQTKTMDRMNETFFEPVSYFTLPWTYLERAFALDTSNEPAAAVSKYIVLIH